jgi:hypothetical protein
MADSLVLLLGMHTTLRLFLYVYPRRNAHCVLNERYDTVINPRAVESSY